MDGLADVGAVGGTHIDVVGRRGREADGDVGHAGGGVPVGVGRRGVGGHHGHLPLALVGEAGRVAAPGHREGVMRHIAGRQVGHHGQRLVGGEGHAVPRRGVAHAADVAHVEVVLRAVEQARQHDGRSGQGGARRRVGVEGGGRDGRGADDIGEVLVLLGLGHRPGGRGGVLGRDLGRHAGGGAAGAQGAQAGRGPLAVAVGVAAGGAVRAHIHII